MRRQLIAHPDFRSDAVSGVDVEVMRLGPASLKLRFVVAADFRHVLWPVTTRPRFADGLWRHSCFEVFVRAAGSEAYCELNLSPSTEWAAYSFATYRTGMKPEAIAAPRVTQRQEGVQRTRTLEATVELQDISALPEPARQPWRIGVSAVIEERDGRLSYWALAHPPGAPDFHHPDCFVAELAAARPA